LSQPPPPGRYSRWTQRIADLQVAGLERTLRTLQPTSATTAMLDGQELVLACSNDYFGLAQDPRIQAAARGGGSGSSRLISGDRPHHRALEDELEDWLGQPALLFPSGFQANLAVFSTVCEPGQVIASDALNHASIIDGIRLSRSRKVIVPHCAPQHIPEDASLIALEGLFSMDGDRPPLPQYPSDPWLAVDEAHALGCLGPDGRGSAAAQGVQPDILIGTFGKAFGAAGAFVAGPAALKALLINSSRPFIYTTGPAEPVVAMARAALQHIRTHGAALREQLASNTTYLRDGLKQLGLHPLGDRHIVPIVFGSQAMQIAENLLAAGVLATGIRHPTVASGHERIRLTVSAKHSREQLNRILEGIEKALRR